jgi:hypothetical protein
MANVVEFVSFKLREGVSEHQFLEASDKCNVGFLSLQKGYIDRKLLKNDDTWADLVLWETMEDAKSAADTAFQNLAAKSYFECIDENNCDMQHLAIVKNY